MTDSLTVSHQEKKILSQTSNGSGNTFLIIDNTTPPSNGDSIVYNSTTHLWESGRNPTDPDDSVIYLAGAQVDSYISVAAGSASFGPTKFLISTLFRNNPLGVWNMSGSLRLNGVSGSDWEINVIFPFLEVGEFYTAWGTVNIRTANNTDTFIHYNATEIGEEWQSIYIKRTSGTATAFFVDFTFTAVRTTPLTPL